MSFWDKYMELCTNSDSSANAEAKKIGIASSTVSNWKSKGAVPQPHTLKKIADHFGVPVSFFAEEKEKAPVSNKKTETLLKLIEMLTPENQDRLIDNISAMLKEQ